MKRPSISRLLSVLLVLLFGIGTAWAAEKGGVKMPDKVTVAGKTLVLNGMGVREATVLNVDVYVAGLYLEKRSKDAAAILSSAEHKHLVLHFVRDVERDDIIEAWSDGFKKNVGKKQLDKLQKRIDKLNAWMTDVAKDQAMSFTIVNDKGVTVKVGGATKGTIEGNDFSRAFLSIWLGDPPNEGLKKGLLGSE